jgi:hypothetical protein
VSCVALTNVVVKAIPFQFTTEDAAKPVPFTVNVKPPSPASTVEGKRELITGATVIVNVTAADAAPPVERATVT